MHGGMYGIVPVYMKMVERKALEEIKKTFDCADVVAILFLNVTIERRVRKKGLTVFSCLKL